MRERFYQVLWVAFLSLLIVYFLRDDIKITDACTMLGNPECDLTSLFTDAPAWE